MSQTAGIKRKIDKAPWHVNARGFADVVLGLLGVLLSIFWITNMHSAPYVNKNDPAVLALQIPYIYFLVLSITLIAVGIYCLKRLESFTRINVLIGYLLLLEGLLMLPVTYLAKIFGPYIPSGGDYLARDGVLFIFGRCPFIFLGLLILCFAPPAKKWVKGIRKSIPPVMPKPSKFSPIPIANKNRQVFGMNRPLDPETEQLEAPGLEGAYSAVQSALNKNPFSQALHYEEARILERMGLLDKTFNSAKCAFLLDPTNQQVETYMHDLETKVSKKEVQS